MNALRRKWIEALRSGDYSQARLYLRTTEGFCCLGVLTDISDIGWILPPTEDSEGTRYYKSKEVRWLNISEDLRKMVDLKFDDVNHLIDMNDAGKSFEEIADYLENLN